MDTKKATIRQLIIASLGAKAGLEHRTYLIGLYVIF